MTALLNPFWHVPTTDPQFANVMLLLHYDGANGTSGTAFIDSSSFNRVRASQSASGIAHTTAQAKFGSASVEITLGSAYSNYADSADWLFGSGAFTVEAFIRPTTTLTGARGIVTQYGGSADLGWFFGFLNFNTLRFTYSTTGTDSPTVNGTYTPAVNQWVHIAADRDASNVLRVYADGVVLGSATVAATFFDSTRTLMIGNDENATRGFIGQIDEVRITKGVARYAGAFTPPTAAFPNS